MKKNKRGIFLPLVIIILLVLGMMGYVFNRVSSTEFRQAYFMSDMMRAQMIAEAAVEEIMADIRAKMNNEDEFRKAFIEGGDIKKYTLEHAKKFKDDLYAMEDDATTNPVSYSVKAKVYCKKDNLEVINSTEDKIGTLVIEVISEVNSVAREIKVSFDYKVVDVRPVGNKYTLMTETNGSNAFNTGSLFMVNATGSDGMSIGQTAIINLAAPYYTISEWQNLNKNLDLHSESPNSMKSLIPGGKEEDHVSDSSKVQNNKPYENSKSGQVSQAQKVHGGYNSESDFEPMVPDCPFEDGGGLDLGSSQGGAESAIGSAGAGLQKMFRPNEPDNYPFNTGYTGGPAPTHLFGKNCEFSEVGLFGDVRKRYTVVQYEFTNRPHVNSPTECEFHNTVKDIATATVILAPYAEALGMVAYMLCACSNPNDWTEDDRYDANDWNHEIKKYTTSDSEKLYKETPISFNADLNLKGDFEDFKKTATRYIENFPEDGLWDTFFTPGGKNLYLEGLVACQDALLNSSYFSGGKIKTPGMLVANNDIEIKNSIKVTPEKISQIDFFKQESVLSLAAFKTIKDEGGRKESVGFFSTNNFENSKMDVKGNLVARNIGNSKKFSGGLTYDNTFKDTSKFLIDSDKSYVITVSPIPSSFVIVNNL